MGASCPNSIARPAIPAESNGVEYAYDEATGLLSVQLDEAWLGQPSRRYPVLVDPSVLLYGNGNDTYVNEGTPGNNSTALTLNVGRGPNGNRNRAFIKFPTSSVAGMNIHEATLNLWQAESSGCANTPIIAYAVADDYPWTNATSWPGPEIDNDLVSTSISSGVGGGPSCPAAVVSGDLTRLTRLWADGLLPNEGLALRALDETLYSQYKKFGSAQTYVPPSLEVTYSVPGLSGAPDTPHNLAPQGVIAGPQPSLTASYSDPQGDPGVVVFRTYLESTGELIATYVSGQVSSGATATVTSSALTLDQGVEWTATARNVSATSYSTTSDLAPLVYPSVYISSPAQYSLADGTTTFGASLAPGVSPASVEFLIDGVVTTTDGSSPYSASGLVSGADDGYYVVSARLVGGASSGTESPPHGVYVGIDPDTGVAPGSGASDESAGLGSPNYTNMMPTYDVPDCEDGVPSNWANGTPCQADNSTHTVHVGQVGYMGTPTREALRKSFDATDLAIQIRETPVYSVDFETDVLYRRNDSMPNNYFGDMFCDDRVYGNRHVRCDQFYVRFNVENICDVRYWCTVGDSDDRHRRRAIACHETGHTVGLVHGSSGNGTVNGVPPDNDDLFLMCMRTGTSVGLEDYYLLGPHNVEEINDQYPRP